MTGKTKAAWSDDPHTLAKEPLHDGNFAAGSAHPLNGSPAANSMSSSVRRRSLPDLDKERANLDHQTTCDVAGAILSTRERAQLTASAKSGNAELATSDAELILRLRESLWLQGRSYRLPNWLGKDDVRGSPVAISADRRVELKKAQLAPGQGSIDQQRYLRNWAVIWFISKQIQTNPPSSDELVAGCIIDNDATALHMQQGGTTGHEVVESVSASEGALILPRKVQCAGVDPRQRDVEPAFQRQDVHEDAELATCDAELKGRLRKCPWLQNRSYALPEWLDRTADLKGSPLNVSEDQKAILRKSRLVPKGNDDRERFFRNIDVIRNIAVKLETAYPLDSELWAKGAGSDNQVVSHQESSASRAPESDDKCAVIDLTGTPRTSPTVEQPKKPKRDNAARRDVMILPAPRQPLLSKPLPDASSLAAVSKMPVSRVDVSLTDQERADNLRQTVLAPFYDRMTKDSDEILRLRQEKEDLMAEIASHQNQVMQLTQADDSSDADDELEIFEPRGIKRKAAPPLPMRLGDETNGNNDHTPEGHLLHLADKICKDLGELVPNETIHLCGLAPVKIMDDRPDVVLQLAHQKIHTWPYSKVPICWRRLFEDATLAKAAQMLRDRAGVMGHEAPPKRRRIGSGADQLSENLDAWFEEIVKVLDIGLSLSGAPGRSMLFEAVFQQLENHLPADGLSSVPAEFSIAPPKSLPGYSPIDRSEHILSFEKFQRYLNKATEPLIIPGVMQDWPASKKWHNPQYLHQLTLGGHRQVPVEIGKSYTDDNWSQQLMTYRQFFQSYLLPANPDDIGYLAQHDLFAQIPALRSDIVVPDYCYTTPPDPKGHAARTAGLKEAPQLQEPMLNAWLGPKGTQTPLHTDPYHNILCQVVGYKYVRLYPPSETEKLYPRGIDEKGISLENTSQLDISQVVAVPYMVANRKGPDHSVVRQMKAKFPLFFEGANCVEGILAPGECLYIPLGWWHYVESLTTSFSVSFWWN